MNTTLTARQARFVAEFLVDCNGAAAAVRAGYAPGSAKVAASRLLTSDNPVRLAIQGRQEADAARLRVTREDVIQRFLEAFELAKEEREPSAMVAAAKELGRMLGMYAPARVEAVVGLEELTARGRYERMTDAELLALVDVGSPS
jgi:phage terminase small subunit